MPRLLDYLTPVYMWLYDLNPDAPKGVFAAMVFAIVLAWRKWFPTSWKAYSALVAKVLGITESDSNAFKEVVMHTLQAVPAAAIGLVLGLVGTGADWKASLNAALVALLAPIGHFLMSRYKGKVGQASKTGPVRMTALLALLLVVALPGCASWKPVARTADGIAESLCAHFFGEKQGISLEEAADQFCATREDLEPWIDQVLAAKQKAGKAALARRPAP